MTLEQTYQKWLSLLPLTEQQTLRLNQKFTIEYNYNSNHLEGNTLTYGQTELLLLFGNVSGNAPLKDYIDMKASAVAMNVMLDIADTRAPLTQNHVRELHKTLLRDDYTVFRNLPNGIQTSYTVHAGQYKTRPNSVVTRYGERFEYASPQETPAMMTDLIDWYNHEEKNGKLTPTQLAALFHYRYIRIHPFEDGNGRIARLMTNYILSRNNWPMVIIRNSKKNDYLEALHNTDILAGPSPSDGANASLGQIRPFLSYFEKVVKKEIQANIDFIESTDPLAWFFDGERLTFRSPNAPILLRTLQENPNISIVGLAEALGINKSAVQKLLATMQAKGYIVRRDDGRTWHVLASHP